MRKFLIMVFLIFNLSGQVSFAGDQILNVYIWSGVIPGFIIKKFEQETGIKVNFSTYDSNEVMYAKLRANKNPVYDIVEPSSYYIDRMRRQGMIEKIEKSKLTNFKNLNPDFLNQRYDPASSYSVPFIWGTAGIFINKDYYSSKSITSWQDLWDKKFYNKLLLLDDSREVFSMSLHSLGYSGNDSNPDHIYKAYLKLKELIPNVKIFNSSVISMVIDEDVTVGMVWNGDLIKASKENLQLSYIYPTDGFVIWVDNFAIPKDAPHAANAYKFLNFMLRTDIAKATTLDNNYATTNLAAQKLLPASIREDITIYPTRNILHRGEFQTDIGDDALVLYEKYWEQLKMGA